MLERTRLAPGLEVTRVITGLWQVADMERGGKQLDPEASAAAMERYVEAGLTTFDMADHYGSAELIAGHYRATREAKGADTRPRTQMLTKWVPPAGKVTAQQTRDAVELARRRLQTERLDLLQFHTWTYDDPAWLDALFHLTDLREQGLIGEIGLTNFDTVHLDMALSSGVPVVSNQVSFSLVDRRALNGLTELCQRKGVKLLAYGTLAGGLLSERWLDRQEPDWDDSSTTWSLNKYRRFVSAAGGWRAYQDLLGVMREVAMRHGASVANVASRAILDTPGVGAVIIGARLGESEHIADTLKLFDLRLTEQDRAQLTAATEQLGPIPGDSGDEYRRPPFLTASGDLSHHLSEMPAPFTVTEDARGRRRVGTGTTWERLAGYARAVRHGNRVLVSGTTAMHGERLIGGTNAAAQTHFVLDKIEGALRSLGASLDDVVRTRVYVTDEANVDAVVRAHGRRFGDIQPANTLVIAGLVGSDQLVEIEAEAIVG